MPIIIIIETCKTRNLKETTRDIELIIDIVSHLAKLFSLVIALLKQPLVQFLCSINPAGDTVAGSFIYRKSAITTAGLEAFDHLLGSGE